MKHLFALNKYLYRYRGRLLLGFIFVVTSNLFAVYPAQVVRHSFDLVRENIFLYHLTEGFQIREAIYDFFGKILLIFGGVVIFLALMRGFFMFMMRQTIIVVSRLIEYDLKNDIYDHFQKLSTAFYRRHNTGDLMARITEDVSRAREYLGPAIMYSINLSSLIILVVSIMISVNPALTFYVLIPLPVLAASIYFVNRIIQKRSFIIQQQLSKITTIVQEIFSGIKVVKSFGAEKAVENYFEKESESYRVKSMALVKVNALFFPLIILLIGFSTLLTLYVGGIEVMKGNITAGNLAEFFIYVNMLAWPVASIGWVTSIVQRAAASQGRINELLETKPEIVASENEKVEVKGNVVFDNVSFVYPDTGIHALKSVSFKINSGETLGIIGRTGSGKSTMANLLFRLYDVTSGKILIEGLNIEDIDLGAYRKQIGYVPQDDFLFSETIANNILFGYHKMNGLEKDKDKLFTTLRDITDITDVKKDILGFPMGFETRLGERGVTLSGGQKQRVAMARAIVDDPRILILDDSLSAVDTHTEARILKSLASYMKGRTSIIISHRVSTVKNANHIIVLDEGKVVEEGDHDTLLELDGYYSKLYEKQMLEREMYQQQ